MTTRLVCRECGSTYFDLDLEGGRYLARFTAECRECGALAVVSLQDRIGLIEMRITGPAEFRAGA